MIFQEYKISNYQYVYVFSENTRVLSDIYSMLTSIPKHTLEQIRVMEKWEAAFFPPFQEICRRHMVEIHSRIDVDEEAKIEYLIFDNYKTKVKQ